MNSPFAEAILNGSLLLAIPDHAQATSVRLLRQAARAAHDLRHALLPTLHSVSTGINDFARHFHRREGRIAGEFSDEDLIPFPQLERLSIARTLDVRSGRQAHIERHFVNFGHGVDTRCTARHLGQCFRGAFLEPAGQQHQVLNGHAVGKVEGALVLDVPEDFDLTRIGEGGAAEDAELVEVVQRDFSSVIR